MQGIRLFTQYVAGGESMKVKIEMEVEFDKCATYEEIEEFCDYNFAERGSCSSDNPLLDADYTVTDFYCETE